VPGLSYTIESQPDPQGRQVYTIELSLFLLEKEYNEITSTEVINKTIDILFIDKEFITG
jgi:hypothetical protein